MHDYYVYLYLRSKDSDTASKGTPYYVGKGRKNRAFVKHTSGPVPKDKANIVFVATCLSDKEAKDLEIKLITEHGRKDLGNGILNNQTNGGEGTSGFTKIPWNKGKTNVYSDEALARMAKSAQNRAPQSAEANEKRSLALKGRPSKRKGRVGEYAHTDEQKKKIALSKLGRKRGPMSEEQKKKLSLAQTGVPKPRKTKS